MNTRRLLHSLAATLVTFGQALIFAADTASTPEAAPTVANVVRLVSGLWGA
jgi:hypothetical protein